MNTNQLFIGEVKNVNYMFDPLGTKSRAFLGSDYTVNITSTIEPNVLIENVRVLTNNLGGLYGTNGGTYTLNPPAVGDFMVCGYLNGDITFPVALGVISNKSRNELPLSTIMGEGTYLLYHESGTYMRIRNKKNEWKPNYTNKGQNITSTSNESEFVLHHDNGHEIVITKDSIVINNSTGHRVFIDENNINIEHVAGNNVSMNEDIISVEHKDGSNLEITEENMTLTHKEGQKVDLTSDQEVLIGDGSHEPIIKGSKFNDWLSQLKTAIGGLNVITALGPSGPLMGSTGWVQVETLFTQLSTDLSTQGNQYFSSKNKVS